MIKISSAEKLIAACIGFVVCMILARIFYSDSHVYLFLLWNIFLGWIPFQVSFLIAKEKNIQWYSILLFGIWLIFFPNALYIVTDLMHLGEKENVPLWYDVILLFSSASTGLIMAFISLHKIESFLKRNFNMKIVNGIIFCSLLLGSFGVYLGRFLRWNSWDIFCDPFRLISGIARLVIFPKEYTGAWAATFVFAAFFFALYLLVKKLPATLTEKESI